jgi:hypothetical protein
MSEAPIAADARQRPSRGRYLLGFVVAAGVASLFCCGGVGLVAIYMGVVFQRGLSEDPAVIRQRAAEIADLAIPPEFEPTSSYEARVPVTNRRILTWAVFESDPEKDQFENYILLGQYYGDISRATRDELLTGVERSIFDQQKYHEQIDSKTLKTVDTRQYTIRDQKAEFIFQQVEGKVSGDKYWIVLGQFAGKGGPAILYIRADVNRYDQAALEKIVESIQ